MFFLLRWLLLCFFVVVSGCGVDCVVFGVVVFCVNLVGLLCFVVFGWFVLFGWFGLFCLIGWFGWCGSLVLVWFGWFV